jgi:hypothetical protein
LVSRIVEFVNVATHFKVTWKHFGDLRHVW